MVNEHVRNIFGPNFKKVVGIRDPPPLVWEFFHIIPFFLFLRALLSLRKSSKVGEAYKHS